MADASQKSFRKAFPAFLNLRRWDGLVVATIVVAALVALPIVSLVAVALSGNVDSLVRLASTILPRATVTTLSLLAGIAVTTGILGALSAWLVTFFQFPGRRLFSWALMLPLAVPTYISAYAFVEFFGFTGPLQSLLRSVSGFASARDYWFPDIRSTGGAILVLSLVLYPYVYLSVRTLFFLQGRRAIEAGEVLGASQWRILTRILLPLARPALALGIILALMEAINDIGAIEYLGVQTLTFSIFSVWVNQNDIAGSAQIALVLLLVVFALILGERLARRGQRYSEIGGASATGPFKRHDLTGLRKWGAIVSCALPVLLGFGVPFFVLGFYAQRYLARGFDAKLINAIVTSIGFASVAAIVTVLLALLLTYTVRVKGTRSISALVRFASIGYAMPGTIIALGIFLPLARFDNIVDAYMRDWFGISTGLLITGSGATLVYAYVVRFMVIAEGSIDGGFKKISSSLDMAARCYGRGRFQTLKEILLPLLHPAIATAALLVFIDSLKELSATLMLRPFGIETLAIYVHDLASRGRIEQASVPSLIIMLVGVIPVIILVRTTLRDR